MPSIAGMSSLLGCSFAQAIKVPSSEPLGGRGVGRQNSLRAPFWAREPLRRLPLLRQSRGRNSPQRSSADHSSRPSRSRSGRAPYWVGTGTPSPLREPPPRPRTLPPRKQDAPHPHSPPSRVVDHRLTDCCFLRQRDPPAHAKTDVEKFTELSHTEFAADLQGFTPSVICALIQINVASHKARS
jgi:hypothetical protein